MFQHLVPDIRLHRVTDLTPRFAEEKGIRLLFLDYDNTLVPYTEPIPDLKVDCWLEEMRSSGILLCVLSNSRKSRVSAYCKEHDIPMIQNAHKPFATGLIADMLKNFGVSRSQAALIGDQIYTDVLAAKLSCISAILVEPIHLHNVFLRIRHVLELPFIHMCQETKLS